MIYTDFKKAFDSVHHEFQALTLKSYGIPGPLSRWIAAFLTNRTQRVVCDGVSPSGLKLHPTSFGVKL